MPEQTSKPIAVQLYSLRHMEQTLAQTLRDVAEIGYRGVETIGNHGLAAAEMKALLAENNLTACSTHVQLAPLEEELEEVIAFNQAIGNDCVILPVPPQEFRAGAAAADWLEFGRRLDAIGQRCTAAGVRFLYHNHAWEMAELDGKLAIDWLFEGASPANLQWEPDIAWIVRGGIDPVQLLMRYAGRCPRVHVKDIAPGGRKRGPDGVRRCRAWRPGLVAAAARGRGRRRRVVHCRTRPAERPGQHRGAQL